MKILDFMALGGRLVVVAAGLVVVVYLETMKLLLLQVVFATELVQLFLVPTHS